MKIRLLPIIRTTLLTLFALPVFANAQNSVNAFSSTGSMSVARNQPAATLLPTGKVLVTGGSDLITFKSSAELYDPTTGTFSLTGSMASFRLGHSSTLLLNGKVLVSGGENNSASKPAELYDPLTGVFTPTGIPLGARTNCPATLLQNGNVLFVGGLTGPGPLVEIYDSVTGQFASVDTGSAAIPQSSHSAALLRDGRVLVTGGFGGSTFTQLATAFLYDPVSNVFSQTGSMSTPRVGGGSGNGLPLNAELYDPLTGTFSLTGLPSVPNRLTHTVTLLPDGAVLVAGGGSGAEVYDPTSGAFSPIIPMITNRITHAAAPLPDGRVLIVGGLDFTNKALASVEAFQRLSPQAPAVLVVPGILGTKLAHCTDPSCQAEDRTVWLTDIVINQELVRIFHPLDDLKYDSSGTPTTSLTPQGPLADLLNLNPNSDNANHLTCSTGLVAFDSSGTCTEMVNTYNSLVSVLTANHYAVQTFPYDWRRDIGELADDLFAQIMALAQQQNRRVALIAHSMGGLIVGEALRRHGAELSSVLGPIATLGTPFSGSVEAYMNLQGWGSAIPFLSNGRSQELGANWTSGYELLPRFDFALDRNNNLLDLKLLYAGAFSPFPVLPRLTALQGANGAYQLWDNAASFTQQFPSAYAFIGSGMPTAAKLQPIRPAAATCPHFVNSGNGDGTVLLSSAQSATWIPPSNFRYVQDDHLQLPSNGQVLVGLLKMLQGLLPDNVSQNSFPLPSTTIVAGCSPINLTVSDASGKAIGPSAAQIQGGKQYRILDHPEVLVPTTDADHVLVEGTGTGEFSISISESDEAKDQVIASFLNVPVTPNSRGTIQLVGGVDLLLYDFDGKGQFDTVPANVIPPTIQCSACSIGEGKHPFGATKFNVGYVGRMSTFSLQSQKGDDGKAVSFVSSRVNSASVGTAAAHFEGIGALNGQPGFSFSVDVGQLHEPDDDGMNTVVLIVTDGTRKLAKVKARIVGGSLVIKPGRTL
jgi:pimeloyl-ACP methyl ester carboxylesterase